MSSFPELDRGQVHLRCLEQDHVGFRGEHVATAQLEIARIKYEVEPTASFEGSLTRSRVIQATWFASQGD